MAAKRNIPALIARVLLGLSFLVFGINFFVPFLPMPTDIPPAAGQFAGALMQSHYVMQIVKAIEVVAGLLLLIDVFVPLALALLAPVLVGILGFHALLEPSGLPLPIVLLLLELFLAYSYRNAFAPMLQAKTAPASSAG